jgi:hypothetical protein
LHLIGPAEFADRVEHKLLAYSLNLLDEQQFDFVIRVAEFNGDGFVQKAPGTGRSIIARGGWGAGRETHRGN